MGNQFGIGDSLGDHWRNMKKAATPPFSLLKIKKSLPLINATCKTMIDYVNQQASLNNTVVCDDLVKRFAVNMLAREITKWNKACDGSLHNIM